MPLNLIVRYLNASRSHSHNHNSKLFTANRTPLATTMSLQERSANPEESPALPSFSELAGPNGFIFSQPDVPVPRGLKRNHASIAGNVAEPTPTFPRFVSVIQPTFEDCRLKLALLTRTNRGNDQFRDKFMYLFHRTKDMMKNYKIRKINEEQLASEVLVILNQLEPFVREIDVEVERAARSISAAAPRRPSSDMHGTANVAQSAATPPDMQRAPRTENVPCVDDPVANVPRVTVKMPYCAQVVPLGAGVPFRVYELPSNFPSGDPERSRYTDSARICNTSMLVMSIKIDVLNSLGSQVHEHLISKFLWISSTIEQHALSTSNYRNILFAEREILSLEEQIEAEIASIKSRMAPSSD